MLEGVITFASYGLGTGGTAGNILFQLEQQGVFAYVLPFLMIFAILFGILSKLKIFGDNKGINIILSLSVALMALQMNFVGYFFREIFPRMGVLLSIILVTMILMGLFWDFEKKGVKFIFGGLILIGVIVIVYQSFGGAFYFGGFSGGSQFMYFLERNLGAIIAIVLVVGGIVAVTKKPKENDKPSDKKVDWNKVMENVVSGK